MSVGLLELIMLLFALGVLVLIGVGVVALIRRFLQ